ncbi:histidine acid phosphatase [Histomonas meleagridis]|uniref:histidine acid phosphatase n=1 Tax=Histomonas meleagridis TaxID=135588 RepID=UPI003559BF71|nr:histidine acid phosphatase [Histomonas meleagridis]KAH0797539.1 histidine acid phosphatase [Histomonas meleagridis]
MFFFLLSFAFSFDQTCVASTSTPPEPPEGYKLVQIQVLTRHGARSPLNALLNRTQRGQWNCDSDDAVSGRINVANLNKPRRIRHLMDPRLTDYPPSCAVGELTLEGMNQHKLLGASYRKYLVDKKFLSTDYINPDEMFVRATTYDRTYRSAISFLNGLYPPARPDEIISVIIGSTYDVLRPSSSYCPEIKQLETDFLNTDSFKNQLKEGQEMFGELGKYLDISITDRSSLEKVCDWVNTLSCDEREIGPSVTSQMISKCRTISGSFMFGAYGGDNNKTRGIAFSTGMREIFRVIDEALSGVSPVKFALHSAHDTSVVAMLTALGQNVNSVPPYASHIAVELFEKDQKYYVRFSFNGNPLVIPMMNSNETIYDMHAFRSMMEPLIDHCKEAQ